MPPFIRGQEYARTELTGRYGGQPIRGIVTPANQRFIMLFSSDQGEDNGYFDEFIDENTVNYYAEGQVGDMVYTHGNRAIRDHQQDGKALYLFRSVEFEASLFTFMGEFRLNEILEVQREDRNHQLRLAIVFNLHRV